MQYDLLTEDHTAYLFRRDLIIQNYQLYDKYPKYSHNTTISTVAMWPYPKCSTQTNTVRQAVVVDWSTTRNL